MKLTLMHPQSMPCTRTPLQSIISSILFRHDSPLQMQNILTQRLGQSQKFHLISPRREHYTSTSPQGSGGGYGGHAEASTTPREPDNTTRYESPRRLGDVGGAVTHVDTLMQGEAVQSTLTVQKHKRDWASLSHTEFDLSGPSASASWRRLGDHAERHWQPRRGAEQLRS